MSGDRDSGRLFSSQFVRLVNRGLRAMIPRFVGGNASPRNDGEFVVRLQAEEFAQTFCLGSADGNFALFLIAHAELV